MVGMALAVRAAISASSLKSSPQLSRTATRAAAREPEIAAERHRAQRLRRLAVAGSLAPRAFPISAPAVTFRPNAGMKPRTMVFASTGNASSCVQPCSPPPLPRGSHRSPAKKRFVSQPHHSHNMRTPPGRARASISPQPDSASRTDHCGHVSPSARAQRANSHSTTAWATLATVYASGAPTKPMRGISAANAAMLRTPAATLNSIGNIVTRWATR
mmetsp:Transcript_87747/g.237906  ORF Transcript_87747/g.237906 Transcript_87747/m.237906 type:complete len:216 (-) Transcript_87747:243-890(-)